MHSHGDSVLPLVLIGCGAVSQRSYLPALRALQSAGRLRVTALVDDDERACHAMAQIFPSAQQTGTLDDVVAPAGSLAIVASGLDTRSDHLATALARRWHVLAEAPISTSTARAHALLETAKAQDVLFAVAHPRRFFPAVRYLRELCQDQPLGALLHIDMAEGGGPLPRSAARPQAGVMLESGIHALDLLIWWLGEPQQMSYSDDAFGGFEINARTELTFGADTTASLHVTRDWTSPQRYRFEFERGLAEWAVDESRQLTLQLSGTRAALRGELLAPLGNSAVRSSALASRAQCLHTQLAHVLTAIRGGEALEISGEQTLAALQWVERCYARRRPLLQPWLTAEEQARLQTPLTETFSTLP